MNTLEISESRQEYIAKVKPLIVFYLENFWLWDIETRKPIIEKEDIEKLKKIAIEAGISQENWNNLVIDFPNIPLMNTWDIRKSLKEVKSQPDASGNVYHQKDIILKKIVEMLEQHIRK
jgi:hypothetical protein